ncbi:hypothetical protein [Pseudoroseicyclus aestuarii]|uniref:Uncharacterized protein n=1 Tax=Pseudoroseicyclus aestuarii TaxID=1795041 RepID=A0A318SYR4_9RHOB|nr:hypothetical protein [Pseudoroseicyclus aestuarii]PYE80887.1 hypothetical protein DFP88_10918 [Pseudoroseicyclus aestuarii]
MTGFRLWLGLAGLLILAGVALPYAVLPGRGGAWDVVLVWSAFGVLVIALIATAVLRWRG